MSKLDIRIPHELTQEEALRRTHSYVDDLKEKYPIKIVGEDWEGGNCKFIFSVRGIPFSTSSGTLAVRTSEVELSGDLPRIFSHFKEKIESTIQEKGRNCLDSENR